RRSVGFFFQAEDGIRDRNVTGVQTCALPIALFYTLNIVPTRYDYLIRFSGTSGTFKKNTNRKEVYFMFGFNEYNFLIYGGILALQYFFSTRKSGYWGIIIPLLFVSGLSWMYATAIIESLFAYLAFLFIGLLILSVEWEEGRNKVKKEGSS